MARRSDNNTAGERWSLNEIKNLITIINKNKIQEFDLEQGEIKIHIVTQYHESGRIKGHAADAVTQVIPMMQAPLIQGMAPAASPSMPIEHPAAPPTTPKEVEEPSAQEKKADDNLVEFKSPMVGTFYRAPSPESPPYVQAGDRLNPDTILCIVEAMKLMNEIKAEMSGTLVDILVENGQPVEYGQPMFKIKPA